MIIRNSIRQLMRTPVKTLFFFILLAGAIMFFMLGYGLHVIAGRNIERLEKSLVTIGTVEQKPSTPNTLAFLRTKDETDYTVIGSPPEYGSPIPLSVLDFEGADYIVEPETRPLYIAYDPGFVVSWNPIEEERRHTYQNMILEMEPLEDCEAGQGCRPVRIKIKKVLCGKPDRDEIWFSSPDTPPMKLLAGKTYIVSLRQHPSMPSDPNINEYFYVPNLVTRSEQYTKDGEWVPDTMKIDTLWDEVTPGFYETPRGRRWQAAVENYTRAMHVIPVVPTNGTKLLMPFYNGDARIAEGRDITQEEYRRGERVCLVQRGFAANNGLTVGDDLRLPMYYAIYGSSSGIWFYDPRGICTNVNSLINARGECYEPFEDGVYRIIGVYDSPAATYNLSEYDLGNNAVVIPSASVKNSDENNLVRMRPMMFGYTTSFQIPNGQIEKYTAAWDALGITGLDIKLYDRGYTKIRAGLEDMNKTASLMFIAGIVTMLFVLILFCHLFISKQRKRTAVERSLGMSKQLCAASLLSGLLFVAAAAYVFGSASGYFLTVQTVKQSNIAQSQESFDAAYSNWRYTVDDNAISKTVVSTDGAAGGIPLAAVVIPATFLIALAMLQGNLKSEPLRLLGEK